MAKDLTLEDFAREYKIFLDTCVLMKSEASIFCCNMAAYLLHYGNKLIIPSKVAVELNKHASCKDDIHKRNSAVQAIRLVKDMLSKKIAITQGEETDNFADNVFHVVFAKHRLNHNLLLITDDEILAEDIMKLNHVKSAKGKAVEVRRLEKNGSLGRFFWQDGSGSGNSVNPEEMFKMAMSVTTMLDTKVNVSYVPKERDTVYTSDGKSVKLLKELGRGGEGSVYETDNPFVAKIYSAEKNTARKREKIRRMVTKNLSYEGICFPVAELSNGKGDFVGYLMPKATGKEIGRSVYLPFLFQHKDWKKIDTVRLCVTILEKVKYLHDRNIILGDINQFNILVNSPEDVYFVDTDSYQIEELPCPVGTACFTSPELQGRDYSTFLRSFGHENFALASLLFTIMLPGKQPYAQQGGEGLVQNIKEMDFSYPLGENTNGKTPDGQWRFMWSHLPYKLKEAFFHTFKKGGNFSTEKTRLGADQWLALFRKYQWLLETGRFGSQDKESMELMPKRFKKNPNAVYIKCRLCGNEEEEHYLREGMCRDCLEDGEDCVCNKCGEVFTYTNFLKYVAKKPRHAMCSDCHEKARQVYQSISCRQCGQLFTITNGEKDFYQENGMTLPRRCKEHRGSRRKDKPNKPNGPGIFTGISWLFNV